MSIRRNVLALLASCSIAGCATMPTEAVDHVSLAAVEERVKCEIGQAYLRLKEDRKFPDLSTWAAGLTLTLSVDSTGGVAPSTSLTGPFGSVSPLDLSFGASLNAKRTALLNVNVAFVEAANHPCPPASPILLEGHLGLAEWIVRVFESQYVVSQNSTLRPSFDNEKSIGYSLEFLITLSAGATPNFVIANTTNTKSAFTLESKSTHSVDIAMVEMDPSDFRKRFKSVLIPAREVEIPNPEFERLGRDAATIQRVPERIKKQIPAQVERREVGVDARLGFATKSKLDFVLQQLNNKVLIQTLRR